MTDDKKDPWGPKPYGVGYGKPPVSGQFVKGKSGNPRGRTKNALSKSFVDQSIRDSFLSSASRPVTIREGGKVKTVPLAEAVQQAEAVAALKGSAQAQKNFLERHMRFKKELVAEVEEDHEFWRKYSANYDKFISAQQKLGRPTETYLHPDDLIFEDGCHVKTRDPVEAARSREVRTQLRDMLILMSEWDRRYSPVADQVKPGEPKSFMSEVLLYLLNRSLPKRLQLNDDQLFFRLLKTQRLKKRELERKFRDLCGNIGYPRAKLFFTPVAKDFLSKHGY